MKILKMILATLVGFISLPSAAPAAETAQWKALRQTIEKELKDAKIPGASIAVVQDGRVVFSEGFGVADVTTRRPVSTNTTFRVGSVAKTFTATALATLAARGQLDLGKPVGAYLPELPPRLRQPTLLQLLSHQAGLKDRLIHKSTVADITGARFTRLFSNGDAFADPNQVFSYSSLGYALAGQAAATAQRSSFADLMRRTVFLPLGMGRTSYDEMQGDSDRAGAYLIRGDRIRQAEVLESPVMHPAGLLNSTAEDVARLATLILGHGRLNGQQLLPAAAIDSLSVPRVPIPGEERSYGLGLFHTERGGETILHHYGDEFGGSASLMIFPDRGIAVVVLANARSRMPQTIGKAVELASGRALPAEPDTTAHRPVDPSELSALPGDYGVFKIMRRESSLEIAPKVPWYFSFADLGRAIVSYGGDRYAFIPADRTKSPTKFAVVRGADGKVAFLFLRGRSFRKWKHN